MKAIINDRFGSRRGLLNYGKYRVQFALGQFSEYRQLDWQRIERLIFICHGNICRSPLAEVVARREGVNAESFGLFCRDDKPADPRAIVYARNNGLSLDNHRSRNVRSMQPALSDLIIVMEPDHLQPLQACRLNGAQVTLAGIWLPKPTPYIHDPYSATEPYFVRCEDQVNAAVSALIKAGKGMAGALCSN